MKRNPNTHLLDHQKDMEGSAPENADPQPHPRVQSTMTAFAALRADGSVVNPGPGAGSVAVL